VKLFREGAETSEIVDRLQRRKGLDLLKRQQLIAYKLVTFKSTHSLGSRCDNSAFYLLFLTDLPYIRSTVTHAWSNTLLLFLLHRMFISAFIPLDRRPANLERPQEVSSTNRGRHPMLLNGLYCWEQGTRRKFGGGGQ
jgi:hypothetical protein